MTTSAYDVGDTRRFTATFRDLAGDLADPSAVTLRLREPDGVETAWTYPAGQVTRDSVGVFYADWPIAKAGRHVARFEATGAVATAEEIEFWARARGAGG